MAEAHSDNPVSCPRCHKELDYVGTNNFEKVGGGTPTLFGELGGLFDNSQAFDVYVCPRCGRVELFVDGIGEQFRPN